MELESITKEWKQKVEKIFGVKFNDDLFLAATTHAVLTKAKKNDLIIKLDDSGKPLKNYNEKLEFLGDAIINTIISSWLMKKYGYDNDVNEGRLTSMRSYLRSNNALGIVMLRLKLAKYFNVGYKTGNINTYLKRLADIFESLVGAVYITTNDYDFTYNVVVNLVEKHFSKICNEFKKDYISQLNEYVQSNFGVTPSYYRGKVAYDKKSNGKPPIWKVCIFIKDPKNEVAKLKKKERDAFFRRQFKLSEIEEKSLSAVRYCTQISFGKSAVYKIAKQRAAKKALDRLIKHNNSIHAILEENVERMNKFANRIVDIEAHNMKFEKVKIQSISDEGDIENADPVIAKELNMPLKKLRKSLKETKERYKASPKVKEKINVDTDDIIGSLGSITSKLDMEVFAKDISGKIR